MTTAFLTIFMLACGASDSGKSQGSAQESGPYIADAPSINPPDTSDATLSAGIAEALSAIMGFDFAPIETGYTAAMAGLDADCPTWSSDGDTTFWFANCTSEDGTTFEGFGAAVDYADVPPENGVAYQGTFLNTVSTIQTPTGETFTGGGQAFDVSGSNGEGYELRNFGVSEGYSWTGNASMGTWMKDPTVLDFVAFTQQSGDFRTLEISGSISGLESVEAVVFDGLLGLNAPLPEGCTAEPSGNISVLDQAGNWFDLEFNGMNTEGELETGAGCDGCATAWFLGYPLFEVCPNLDEIYDWAD
jgi:hypothetical protein